MQFAVALERVIAAPRSKIYRAWLDPAMLAGWFGPDDFSVTVATVDERVGGEHHEPAARGECERPDQDEQHWNGPVEENRALTANGGNVSHLDIVAGSFEYGPVEEE